MSLALFALFLMQGAAYSQSFYFNPSTNIPGLRVDSTGRTFLAADNYLYRLNAQLLQEERVDIGAIVIDRGLALSSTGMVVVCLEDLSCSVYNASNISAGPIWSISNAITSVEAAIFTSGDTFYTGGVTGVGETQRMVLQQFGEKFNRSSDNNSSGTRNELVFGSGFARQFYSFGGFVSGGFAYYVVVDNQPVTAPALRLLRVCNMPDCGGPNTCGVTALYELGVNCGFQITTEYTHVCAVSLVDDFSGISGPTALVTICFGNYANFICLVNVTAVNEAMDAKYDSCIVSRTVGEEIGLTWRTGISENCDTLPQPQVCMYIAYWCTATLQFIFQVTGDRCDTPSPVGLIIPNDGIDIIAPIRVNLGVSLIPLASVAVKVEQFSFVFVATYERRIRGVS